MRYNFQQYCLDTDSQELIKHNKTITLTKVQYDLLLFLVQNPAKMFSKEEIFENVWQSKHVTQNSIDQIVSKLRKILDSQHKDEFIKTVYAKGVYFVPEVTVQEQKKNSSLTDEIKSNNPSRNTLLIALLIIFISFAYFYNQTDKKEDLSTDFSANRIIILPSQFNEGIEENEQKGFNTLLKSTIGLFNQKNQTLIDETIATTQQAIEKHYKLEKDLLVVRSTISKIDNLYQVVIELTNSNNEKTTTTISAQSLNELLNNQINLLAQYNKNLSKTQITKYQQKSSDQQYIQALGYQKSGLYTQAAKILKDILQKNEQNYQARLSYAEVLTQQQEFDQAQAELETLKNTSAHAIIGPEIELELAKITFAKNKFQQVIDDLKSYLAQNLGMNTLRKAKIQLQIGSAYQKLADVNNALLAYKNAIMSLDPSLNPNVFAQSYYLQGKLLFTNQVNDSVIDLFKQSIEYAKLANNTSYQIKSLSLLSTIYFDRFQWDKATESIKKVIELAEIDHNQSVQVNALSTLVLILNQRGSFSQANKINQKIKAIAETDNNPFTMLRYYFHDAVYAMNTFDWNKAQKQIKNHYDLSLESENYNMLLNNAFLDLELRLLKHDLTDFVDVWNQRVAFIKEHGFSRIQVYMDYYFARYLKQKKQTKKAIEMLNAINKKAESNNDNKMIVDVQNQLAEIYLEINPEKSLKILNALEEKNPHPNPYLELKAKALFKLGKKIQAMSVINQAKQAYNESWTAQNQALLQTIADQLH